MTEYKSMYFEPTCNFTRIWKFHVSWAPAENGGKIGEERNGEKEDLKRERKKQRNE